MHDLVNDYLVQLAVTVALSVLAAALGFAARWLNTRARWADAQTKAHDLGLLADLANAAVRAVEQVASKRTWDAAGKKAVAVRRVEDMAAKAGIAVSDTQIDTFIEAAVKTLKEGAAAIAAPRVDVAVAASSAAAAAVTKALTNPSLDLGVITANADDPGMIPFNPGAFATMPGNVAATSATPADTAPRGFAAPAATQPLVEASGDHTDAYTGRGEPPAGG